MIPYEQAKPVGKRRNWDDLPQRKKPDGRVIELHERLRGRFERQGWKADPKVILPRGAKDFLMSRFYPDGPYHTRGGWRFDFRPAMNRYVVIGGPCSPKVMYAPDKTAIRKTYPWSHKVSEIHQIPNQVRERYQQYREENGYVQSSVA